MNKQIAKVSAVATAALIVPLLGITSPAQAVSCTSASHYTATSISSSTKFDATSTCDGVYAITAATYSDYVRGRYYKDSSWQVSTYGYVYVANSSDGIDKIVGNTVTGRDIKGQSLNYNQQVGYAY